MLNVPRCHVSIAVRDASCAAAARPTPEGERSPTTSVTGPRCDACHDAAESPVSTGVVRTASFNTPSPMPRTATPTTPASSRAIRRACSRSLAISAPPACRGLPPTHRSSRSADGTSGARVQDGRWISACAVRETVAPGMAAPEMTAPTKWNLELTSFPRKRNSIDRGRTAQRRTPLTPERSAPAAGAESGSTDIVGSDKDGSPGMAPGDPKTTQISPISVSICR